MIDVSLRVCSSSSSSSSSDFFFFLKKIDLTHLGALFFFV